MQIMHFDLRGRCTIITRFFDRGAGEIAPLFKLGEFADVNPRIEGRCNG